MDVLDSFCAVSQWRRAPWSPGRPHCPLQSEVRSGPERGRCQPRLRAPPRPPGVGKFPEGRLDEGVAARAISFHLRSWGAPLRTASPTALSPLRLHPALAVPSDAERREYRTKQKSLPLKQSKHPLPKLKRCQGRAGCGEILALAPRPRVRAFCRGLRRALPRGRCEGAGEAGDRRTELRLQLIKAEARAPPRRLIPALRCPPARKSPSAGWRLRPGLESVGARSLLQLGRPGPQPRRSPPGRRGEGGI